jgi:hypothetical protein
MANALYDQFVISYLEQGTNQVDFDTADIRAILIDVADYTVNLTTDDYLDDVPGAARVATSGALTPSRSGRVIDLTDVTWSTVSGDPSEAIVLYAHTGTEATSRLIAYIDTATGLPVTPSGGDITVTWDNGANKVFKL